MNPEQIKANEKLKKWIKNKLLCYKLNQSLGALIDNNLEMISELVLWIIEDYKELKP